MHNIYLAVWHTRMDTLDSVTEYYYNNIILTAAVYLVHTLSICD